MSNSVVNVVSGCISEATPVIVEMLDFQDSSPEFDKVTQISSHLLGFGRFPVETAAINGGSNFNIVSSYYGNILYGYS